MNISVIGTGRAGLVSGACFAKLGHQVTCMDNDARRIGLLHGSVVPFHEPGLEDLVREGVSQGRLRFTADLKTAVESSRVVFIAVGTPSREDGSADLSSVEDCARGIAAFLDAFKVIVVKSTVPAGTGRRLRDMISLSAPCGARFSVASNPEFLSEGTSIDDFLRPNRIVVGVDDAEAQSVMRELYPPQQFPGVPVVYTEIATSEISKYASNAFLATKISFINEVADLCERAGADVETVARVMGLDRRIGTAYLKPGPGYGGSCLTKDIAAYVEAGRRMGCGMEIAEAVAGSNRGRRLRMAAKVREAFGGTVRGRRLGVLGLSFKPDTGDLRDAPAVDVIGRLMEEGAAVQAYDPGAPEDAGKALPGVKLCADEYEAASGADGLILFTEWARFRAMDLERIRRLLRGRLFVDLRNVFDGKRMRELGFDYVSVGRPAP